MNHPLIVAAKERAVCVANGFGVQLAFRKNLFAILCESIHSNLFNNDVAAAIQKHIPWTRNVRESKTDFCGATIDLIPFIAANKDLLVLKPGGEYGGKGVILGWEVNQTKWQASIQEALSSSYIVQGRVNIGSEAFPSLIDGKLTIDDRYFDLDPYVWNGEHIEGCGVRLSRSALLNVSAGGGSATPMFILQ
jgi:uncharacterized circularly permuted ATP-grasp superfamily protein